MKITRREQIAGYLAAEGFCRVLHSNTFGGFSTTIAVHFGKPQVPFVVVVSRRRRRGCCRPTARATARGRDRALPCIEDGFDVATIVAAATAHTTERITEPWRGIAGRIVEAVKGAEIDMSRFGQSPEGGGGAFEPINTGGVENGTVAYVVVGLPSIPPV